MRSNFAQCCCYCSRCRLLHPSLSAAAPPCCQYHGQKYCMPFNNRAICKALKKVHYCSLLLRKSVVWKKEAYFLPEFPFVSLIGSFHWHGYCRQLNLVIFMNTKGDLNEVNLHSVWPRYYKTRHFEDTFKKFLLGNKARYSYSKIRSTKKSI